MSPSDYDQIELQIGDNQDDLTPLSEIVERARRAAAEAHYRDSYDLLMEAVQQLQDFGLWHIAMDVLAQIREIVPSTSLDRHELAWLLNAEGLAYGALGQNRKAMESFQNARAIGEQLADRGITSTALQNLGIQSHTSGELLEARRLYIESLIIKLEISDYHAAIQLLLNLASLSMELSDLQEAERLLSEAKTAIRLAQDPHLQQSLHGNLGNLATRKGDFQRAENHFRRALYYARNGGDIAGELQSMQNLAASRVDQGRISSAIGWYRRALGLAEVLGTLRVLHSLHAGLAVAFHRAGNNAESALHFGDARTLADALGNKHAWATATADLGALEVVAGNSEGAAGLLGQALEAFMALGDQSWEARVLGHLAEVARIAGDTDAATQALEQAVNLLPEDSHEERVDLLRRAAEICSKIRTGRERAVALFERCLMEQEAMMEPGALAWQYALAGAALSGSGWLESSLPFYARGLEIFERNGDEHMAFHVRNDRAIVLANMERFEEARQDYALCLATAIRLDDRAMKLQTSLNLGETARRQKALGESLLLLLESIDLARQLADERSEADVLGNLGLTLADAGYWEESQTVMRYLRTFARRLRDPSAEAHAVGGLARIAFERGRYAEAARFYRRAADLWSKASDSKHLVEDIAALTETLAALGREEQLQEQAQRLVDLAQTYGENRLASEALARAARWWLERGQLDDAASLYAAAVALAAATPNAEDETLIREISQVFMLMVVHVRVEMTGKVGPLNVDQFYGNVITKLNEQYEGIGSQLRQVLDMARNVGATIDLDDAQGTSEAAQHPGMGARSSRAQPGRGTGPSRRFELDSELSTKLGQLLTLISSTQPDIPFSQ